MPSTGVLELDLKHQDPRFRIQAASRAVTENRVDLVPALVENLSDPDPAVRMFTATALRKLTNRDFDFRPYGSEAEREEAIERWKDWLRNEAGPGARAAAQAASVRRASGEVPEEDVGPRAPGG